MLDVWLTSEEAADYLKVSPRTLTDMVSRREVRVTRLGEKLLRFRTAWLDEYLEGRELR